MVSNTDLVFDMILRNYYKHNIRYMTFRIDFYAILTASTSQCAIRTSYIL